MLLIWNSGRGGRDAGSKPPSLPSASYADSTLSTQSPPRSPLFYYGWLSALINFKTRAVTEIDLEHTASPPAYFIYSTTDGNTIRAAMYILIKFRIFVNTMSFGFSSWSQSISSGTIVSITLVLSAAFPQCHQCHVQWMLMYWKIKLTSYKRKTEGWGHGIWHKVISDQSSYWGGVCSSSVMETLGTVFPLCCLF